MSDEEESPEAAGVDAAGVPEEAAGVPVDAAGVPEEEETGESLSTALDAVLEDLEMAVPAPIRTQVSNHPIPALLIGLGIGLFIGMKKGTDIMSAGSGAVAAAATAGLSRIFRGDSD